jgi:transposase
MKTYSMDLRERVVRACDEKIGTRQGIAELFGVSTAWIRRLLQRRRETGDFAPRRRGGRKPPKFAGKRLEKLKTLAEKYPDATLQELRDRCRVNASIMAVHRALQRLGSRLKKRRSIPVSKTGRT